jgi:pilus assembly protein Flp/PilA
MMRLLRLLAECRKAATAVEYGLILALVVLTMFGALQLTAGATTDMWNNVSTKVQAAH